jgi:hypothetical protein
MIRILIQDGFEVIVDAVVDVPKRRVVSLLVEPSHPLRSIYLAESMLALELEIYMADRASGTPLPSREQQTQQLTPEMMARAMGLLPCKAEWDTACEMCDEASLDWMRSKGQVLSGWCNACLPAAYDDHLIEQAELDRLVEADDGLKPELRAVGRPDVPTCEGGCE